MELTEKKDDAPMFNGRIKLDRKPTRAERKVAQLSVLHRASIEMRRELSRVAREEQA